MRPSFLFPVALLVAGCVPQTAKPSHADLQTAPAAQAQAEEAAIAAALSGIANPKSDYKLSPADLLEVTVYREEELGRTVRVSQNGEISLPLVGTLKVGGSSLQDAQARVAEKFAEYLVNPQVTVFIKEYGNKKIYVLGEVAKPGSLDLPPESKLTVLEAISMSGGFSAVAAKDRTRVIRAGEGGKSQSWTVEVSAITTGGRKDKDMTLEPNDVVFVPQSFF